MELRYGDAKEPAPDLTTLTTYLRDLEGSEPRRFAYRGQDREYDTPLWPSLYRIFADPRYDPVNLPSTPAGFGKRFGRVFIPGKPSAIMEFLFKKYLVPLLDKSLETLPAELRPFAVNEVDPQWIENLLSLSGVCGTDVIDFRSKNIQSIDKTGVINTFHRLMIRHVAAQQPFGNPISEFLCQQYGITSGFLDASLSLEVAAFFACNRGPLYVEPLRSGIGLIYRFEIPPISRNAASPFAPPNYVGEDIFCGFETPSTKTDDIKRTLYEYHATFFAEGRRDLSRLRVPKGALEHSRIGRQRSVMISPAIIADSGDKTSMIGVEDLRFRPGTSPFFFCQTASNRCHLNLTRNHLWPLLGDVFKHWISYDLFLETKTMATFVGGELVKIPKRPDLISPGYDFSDQVRVQSNIFIISNGNEDNQAIKGMSLPEIGERLNGIVESVNELRGGRDSIQVSAGYNSIDLGRQSFQTFLVGGLLDNEMQFLDALIGSGNALYQSAKPLALLCRFAIMQHASETIGDDIEDLYHTYSMILTAAVGADHFLDYENAFRSYFNFTSSMARQLDKDGRRREERALLKIALRNAIGEIVDSYEWLHISGIELTQVTELSRSVLDLLE